MSSAVDVQNGELALYKKLLFNPNVSSVKTNSQKKPHASRGNRVAPLIDSTSDAKQSFLATHLTTSTSHSGSALVTGLKVEMLKEVRFMNFVAVLTYSLHCLVELQNSLGYFAPSSFRVRYLLERISTFGPYAVATGMGLEVSRWSDAGIREQMKEYWKRYLRTFLIISVAGQLLIQACKMQAFGTAGYIINWTSVIHAIFIGPNGIYIASWFAFIALPIISCICKSGYFFTRISHRLCASIVAGVVAFNVVIAAFLLVRSNYWTLFELNAIFTCMFIGVYYGIYGENYSPPIYKEADHSTLPALGFGAVNYALIVEWSYSARGLIHEMYAKNTYVDVFMVMFSAAVAPAFYLGAGYVWIGGRWLVKKGPVNRIGKYPNSLFLIYPVITQLTAIVLVTQNKFLINAIPVWINGITLVVSVGLSLLIK